MKDQSPALPREVVVVFGSKLCNSDPSKTFPARYAATTTAASLGIDAACRPAPLVFRDSAYALYDGVSDEPTNKAALDALARKIAEGAYAWYGWKFDRVYNGILDLDASPVYDEAIFSHRLGDLYTRIIKQSYDDPPFEMLHRDPADDACTNSLAPFVAKYRPKGVQGSSSTTLYVEKTGELDKRLISEFLKNEVAACTCSGTPPCTAVFRIHVAGCNVLFAGVTVNVKINGVNQFDGVTDSNGDVTFVPTLVPANAPVTMTTTMTPPGGTRGSRFSVTVKVETNVVCQNRTFNYTLNVASGYSCSPEPCCTAASQDGGGGLPYPTPVTFPGTTYLTDPQGTTTLNLICSPSAPVANPFGRIVYYGASTRTAHVAKKWIDDGYGNALCGYVEEALANMHIFVYCIGSGWVLQIVYELCYDYRQGGCVGGCTFQGPGLELCYPATPTGFVQCTPAPPGYISGLYESISNISSSSPLPPCSGLAKTFTVALHRPIGFGSYFATGPSSFVFGDPYTWSIPSVDMVWTQ